MGKVIYSPNSVFYLYALVRIASEMNLLLLCATDHAHCFWAVGGILRRLVA